MKNINTNPTKTCHVHVRDFDTAARLTAALTCSHETIEYDAELSKRAGYTVQIVTFDKYNPNATTATISHLGNRFEINDTANGATTCIWWDED